MPAKKNTAMPAEVEVRLAWEVEKRPILWDASLEIYKRADLKSSVWEEVAKCLGPDYTDEMVASRFKNMKDTYMSNHRKVKESKNRCSGAGADDIYKPKWWLFKHLTFLTKVCAPSESVSNIPTTDQNERVQFESDSNQRTPLEKDMLSTVNIYYDYNLQQFMSILPDDTSINSLPRVQEESSESSMSSVASRPVHQESSFAPLPPASAPATPTTEALVSTSTASASTATAATATPTRQKRRSEDGISARKAVPRSQVL